MKTKLSDYSLSGGRQKNWDQLKDRDSLPLITIITSTFNAANDLHYTINSIRKQDYPRVQWIIADGGSEDQIVELLSENEDIVDVWFSESDRGIYDAWNKALQFAKGDWIQFIGAGDELYQSDTLSQVSSYLIDAFPNYDFVYGDVQILSEHRRVPLFKDGGSWETLSKIWSGIRPKLPSHPGVFATKQLFTEPEPFEIDYKVTSDCHFMLSKLEKPMLYMPITVDLMPQGGVSSQPESFLRVHKEMKRWVPLIGIKPPLHVKWLNEVRYFATRMLFKFLPKSLAASVLDLMRQLIGKTKIYTIK